MRRRLAIVATTAAALALPATAFAHIERPAYWPDPGADRTVTPAAGGAVPEARSLSSALDATKPGDTRVVCQDDSLERLEKSLMKARARGYHIRPTDHERLTGGEARRLLSINRELFEQCEYDEIQPAVNDSGNNDRVVVMPGIYTEPTARSKRTFDPACDQYERRTEFGDPGALSYEYHLNCPNDQNLIAVMGREKGAEPAPDPPRYDRHGIPDVGPCIRCNFQIEGSGVSADDVVIDAGRVESGNKGPHGAKKDVGIRADRADGFVLRNMTVRHAKEHGIYVLEADGYLLDRFKTYYNGLYGTLTFVADHGVQQHCEGVGHADSAIYPGSAAETGVERNDGTPFRYNQEIRYCDLHHNLAGYSGTDGNAVHIHHNNIYDNALGIQTDIATAAGHPGFPGDSMLVEKNRIYSNNFNPYEPGSDVEPAFPFPVGTGMWIAGGNHHEIRNNWIYDNWRRGTMIFTIPDVLICGPQTNNNNQKGCAPEQISTSHYNVNAKNIMGKDPDGPIRPNGVDFWWDDFPGSRGNCWYGNTGPQRMVMSPRPLPDCFEGTVPDSSIGVGNASNEGELIACLAAFETRDFSRQTTTCSWLFSPRKPKKTAEGREVRDHMERARYGELVTRLCAESPDTETCQAYTNHLLDIDLP